MTKIAYNTCYGGFSISKEAMQRYCELTGAKFHVEKSKFGSYEFAQIDKGDGVKVSAYDVGRTDPVLIQVIEELGERADSFGSKLAIRELPPGTRYRIDEYDGLESVMTVDEYEWDVA